MGPQVVEIEETIFEKLCERTFRLPWGYCGDGNRRTLGYCLSPPFPVRRGALARESLEARSNGVICQGIRHHPVLGIENHASAFAPSLGEASGVRLGDDSEAQAISNQLDLQCAETSMVSWPSRSPADYRLVDAFGPSFVCVKPPVRGRSPANVYFSIPGLRVPFAMATGSRVG